VFRGVRTFVGDPIYTAEILERPIILQPKTGICAQRRSTAYRDWRKDRAEYQCSTGRNGQLQPRWRL